MTQRSEWRGKRRRAAMWAGAADELTPDRIIAIILIEGSGNISEFTASSMSAQKGDLSAQCLTFVEDTSSASPAAIRSD